MKQQRWVIGIAVAILATAGIFFSLQMGTKTNEAQKEVILTPFGQYLKDNGVKIYGAFWCPHCQNLKKTLGEGTWEGAYVECAVKGSNKMFKQCEDAKIEGFPTIELKDGTRKVGELSLDEFKAFVGYTDPKVENKIIDVK